MASISCSINQRCSARGKYAAVAEVALGIVRSLREKPVSSLSTAELRGESDRRPSSTWQCTDPLTRAVDSPRHGSSVVSLSAATVRTCRLRAADVVRQLLRWWRGEHVAPRALSAAPTRVALPRRPLSPIPYLLGYFPYPVRLCPRTVQLIAQRPHADPQQLRGARPVVPRRLQGSLDQNALSLVHIE